MSGQTQKRSLLLTILVFVAAFVLGGCAHKPPTAKAREWAANCESDHDGDWAEYTRDGGVICHPYWERRK